MNLVIHYVHDVMVVLQVSNLKVKTCNAFKLQVPLVVTLFYCLETMRQQIETNTQYVHFMWMTLFTINGSFASISILKQALIPETTNMM